MPEKETIERVRRDRRQGKAPSTQAGEFVREEIEHVREGKHGARSTKQAIAIGLSKARRAGVKLPPPKPGRTSSETRERAVRDVARGRAGSRRKPAQKRSRATLRALKREGRAAVSRKALARQARTAARRRPDPRAGYATTGGRRSAHGAADSKAAAARSTVASSRQGPASWSPTGSPSRVKPHGIEIAGRPTTVKA